MHREYEKKASEHKCMQGYTHEAYVLCLLLLARKEETVQFDYVWMPQRPHDGQLPVGKSRVLNNALNCYHFPVFHPGERECVCVYVFVVPLLSNALVCYNFSAFHSGAPWWLCTSDC
jgi:hypothetical protein